MNERAEGVRPMERASMAISGDRRGWIRMGLWCAGVLLGATLLSGPARAQPDQPDQQQDQEEQPVQPKTAPEKKPQVVRPAGKGAEKQPSAASTHPGRALFEQSRQAVAKARGFSFHLASGGTGKLGGYAAKIEADVWMARAARAVLPAWHMRMKGTSTNPQGVKTDFDVAWLDSTLEWRDEEDSTIKERVMNEARRAKPVSQGNAARFEELLSGQPFRKELAAEDYTIEERAAIGGVTCDVVVADVNSGRLKVRWWLGVDDHLPRKSETIFTGNLEGTKWVEVTNLKVYEKSEDVPEMRVMVPPGFKEDRVVPTPPPKPAPAPVTPGEVKPEPGKSEPGKPEAAPKPASKPVPVVRLAPAFELTDAAGAKVSLDSLRGKVVVAEFAGTWSLGVADARREFQALLDKHKGKALAGLSIAVREKSRDGAIDEFKKGNFGFDLLLDGDEVAKGFGVAGYPSYVVIDGAGEIVKGPTPYRPSDTLNGMDEAVTAQLAKLEGSKGEGGKQEVAKPDASKPAATPAMGESSLVPPTPTAPGPGVTKPTPGKPDGGR
ncbi:MAG: redoxin domain-containing protein [Tepidisphaera sp.]|nr:redoxin domain-containing protein [Tepidisphaera sp.]